MAIPAQSTGARTDRMSASQLGFNLAAIAVVILMAGLAAAYWVETMVRAPAARANAETVERTIAGLPLTVPVAWFRTEGQAVDGFATQIDLTVALAALGGADVDLTILPRPRVQPSAALLDGVYIHQFVDGEVGGVPGLVGKHLRDSGGFQGETVWYDALSANPFVAKCAPVPAASTEDQCLRTVVISSDLAVLQSFPASLLPRWRELDAAMAPVLAAIGVPAP